MKTHPAKNVHWLVTMILPAAMAWQVDAIAAEGACAPEYAIDVTFNNGARWDMCWEHSLRNGITLHSVYYTPVEKQRQLVLYQAEVSQVHVPYDDNGARYHDITDYGFGERNLYPLRQEECIAGNLLALQTKPIICQQVQQRGLAFRSRNAAKPGEVMSLFSVSHVGSYNYIPKWQFFDDGSIDISMGATGSLQRFGNVDQTNRGWIITPDKIGLAHTHNFFWRLDFDLGGTKTSDYVEELNFVASTKTLELERTRLETEAARDINPETLRSWLISGIKPSQTDGDAPLAYEIQLKGEQRDTGPASEPFTQHDIYFTKTNSCERFASHNEGNYRCGNDLSAFVNGETIKGQDIVVWPTATFHHMPRTEDMPSMDAHWSSIHLTPFNWGGDYPANP